MIDARLRDLRAFSILAEELHFERAAARLGTTQPYLSQIIRRVENVVGTRLLDRRPRTRLTPAGRAFLDAARRILAEAEYGVRLANREAESTPAVVVGFASTAMFTEAPLFIERFVAGSQVDVRLRELHSAVQADALRTGAIDLALMRERPDDPAIACESILEEPLVAVIGRTNGDDAPGSVAASGLADHPFILFPRSLAPHLHTQIMATCSQAGFTPRVAQEVEEWHTVVALVAAGFGVSIAPASVRRMRWDGVHFPSLKPSAARVQLYLCWLRGQKAPGAAGLRDALLAGIAATGDRGELPRPPAD